MFVVFFPLPVVAGKKCIKLLHGQFLVCQYVFPDLFVRWIIVTSDNIREFKVIQDHINSIIVKVDLMDSDTGIEDRLKAKLTSELGRFEIFKPEITIGKETIRLPRERNKFKRFESHVEMPGSQV